MAAAVPASAVESSVAMKAACSKAAVMAATDVAVSASVSVAGPIAVPSTIEAGVAIVTVAPVAATEVSRAPIAVIPGTSADEDAAHEVVRAIVAVGSAGVRIITVVAIGTDRCWSNGDADGTYSNANSDLGLRASRSEKQNCKEGKIF